MKTIMKINVSYVSQFNNARHAQFHRKQHELVHAADQAKLHMPAEVMNEWYSKILREVEINKEAAASVLSQRLIDKDKERDGLLSNLFGIVKAQKKSPVKVLREAAEVLDVAMHPYTEIQGEAFEVESAHVAGLLVDLGKHGAEVAALGLTMVINELRTVNDAYEQLRGQRRADAVANQLPPSRVVRPQTDEAFEVVCQYIQAAYLFATADDDKQMIATLVDGMNKITAEFKASHNESWAQQSRRGDELTR